MTYGKVHRFFLRSIASCGVLSVEEATRILHQFSENNVIPVQNLVKDINHEIRPFQQAIKITNDELTNEEVIVFLSLGYDEATKSQNLFSATELEYFRLLIEEIMTTETRQITGIHAMNIASKVKTSFAKTDAQKLLNSWCKMRYLDKDNSNYALGVRAIHEFESYFRQNMPDTIEDCVLCKQIVFRGCNCPACGKAVHTRCLNKYLEKVEKWPCCKSDFSPEQLERLNNLETLTQTQLSIRESQAYDTVVEPTQNLEAMEDETSQDFIPEISQRINRKRKRQNV